MYRRVRDAFFVAFGSPRLPLARLFADAIRVDTERASYSYVSRARVANDGIRISSYSKYSYIRTCTSRSRYEVARRTRLFPGSGPVAVAERIFETKMPRVDPIPNTRISSS